MRVSTLFMLLTVAAGSASARPAPPLDFVPIGNPGNRDTIPSEVPNYPHPVVGGVDYEFQITRSPITVEQWFEFVDAYAPYTDYRGQDFLSSIGFWNPDGTYYHLPGREQTAVEVAWRYAARYCNWLHNGKADAAWAFETGAYDTSTFGTGSNGFFTDQPEPSADARYWLPSIDEWAKAVYYDVNRYGQGQDGYWLYPNGSNTAPGPGETDAFDLDSLDPPLPIGSYPDVVTPYGLLDVSGGVIEWLGTADIRGRRRWVSSHQGIGSVGRDRIDDLEHTGLPFVQLFGFRVASQVPAPFTGLLLGLAAGCLSRRRRYHVQSSFGGTRDDHTGGSCGMPRRDRCKCEQCVHHG